jgi:hypothetical protein
MSWCAYSKEVLGTDCVQRCMILSSDSGIRKDIMQDTRLMRTVSTDLLGILATTEETAIDFIS